MSEQIFRKAALDRLSSPEELDSLMQVTSPKAWLGLISLGGLVIVAILWGIWGTIPTKVNGQGILVRPGGILEILSKTSGQVIAVYSTSGESVQRGQIIARVEQNKLLEDIKHARAVLMEMKEEHEKVSRYGSEDIKMRMEYLVKKRKDIEKAIQTGQSRLKWLHETLKNRRELLEQGLITKQAYNKAREDIDSTILEVEKARSELKETAIQELQVKEQRERELIVRQQKIAQQERLIAGLEYDLEENSKIVSPTTGRVLEITAQEGKLIDKGARILTLERMDDAPKELEAIIYVSPAEGKKVRPGMKILISPSSIKQEESGSIMGLVTTVSEFPATPQGMMRSLQNEKLVQTLSVGGAPIELHADLIADPTTASAYKWSSGKGPEMKLQSGTLCTGSIVVEEQPPINLAIPMLKKTLFGN